MTNQRPIRVIKFRPQRRWLDTVDWYSFNEQESYRLCGDTLDKLINIPDSSVTWLWAYIYEHDPKDPDALELRTRRSSLDVFVDGKRMDVYSEVHQLVQRLGSCWVVFYYE